MVNELEFGFVLISASDNNGDRYELPTNPSDRSLPVRTLKEVFPNSTGLTYKNESTNAFRIVSKNPEGNAYLEPSGGWKNRTFTVISNTPAAPMFTADEIAAIKALCQPKPEKAKTSASRVDSPLMFDQVPGEENDCYLTTLQPYLRCTPISGPGGKPRKGCVTVINSQFCITNAHIAVPSELEEYERREAELMDAWTSKSEAGTSCSPGKKSQSPDKKKPKMDVYAKLTQFRKWTGEREVFLIGERHIDVYDLEIDFNKPDCNKCISTTIVKVSFAKDFVVLQSKKSLLPEGVPPLRFASDIFVGQNYIALGLPLKYGEQNVSVLKGHITSRPKELSQHLYGAYGAEPGYSGGPVIRLGCDSCLLGIIVGGDQLRLSANSTNKELADAINRQGTRAPLAHILPMSMFVEYCSKPVKIDRALY